ncbi:MAG TPA: FAD-binding oxidoreductase [Beijerinckiaceae bacterium]|nr:FAD-binding oxidoreductase [Beijerinckiaceae bacterium]
MPVLLPILSLVESIKGIAGMFDVVVAGGAVMGSSIACHLAGQSGFAGSILVVERDRSYRQAASALSASSIRQQFSQPVNIRISMHGIAFLRDIGNLLEVDGARPDIGLREGGYLYLATVPGMAVLSANHILQAREGADIALMDRAALSVRFPFLATEDLAGGSFGRSGEGWFDGYQLMQAFAAKARSLGVTYRQAGVVAVERQGPRIVAVHLDDGSRIPCGAFVNAAGASGARALAAACDVPIPVYAKKRSVFSWSCRERLDGFPLLIDTSGVWCRPEGEGFIGGYSPADDSETDEGQDFEVNWNEFDEVIWPNLAARIPAFEAIRPGRAWAGHYDMNLLDHNAIVGRLGDLENAYIAAGFSGHGLQQAPAVGRGLAELIATGAYRTLDLADLSFERIVAGRPLRETNVI